MSKQGMFSDKDRALLEATSKSTWTPPNPVDLIIPYLEKDGIEGESDLDKRRRKAKEVMDGYAEVITKCQNLRKFLDEKCADVIVPLDPKKDLRVIESARRVFKRDVSEITFDMYKQIVFLMAKTGNDGVPTI